MMALLKNFFAEKQTTSETQKSAQCGTWTKHAEGGTFTSPNYPSKYPPDRECVYIIEGAGADGVHVDLPQTGLGDSDIESDNCLSAINETIRLMNK